MDTSLANLLCTLILGVVGVIITSRYNKHIKNLTQEKLQQDLFKEFNARYQLLNDDLVRIEREYPTLEKLNQSQDADQLRQRVIEYFILCAEEFYWYHHKKRIDALIWNSWQVGMNYWYNRVPAIKSLWESEVKAGGKASYYITDKHEFFREEGTSK